MEYTDRHFRKLVSLISTKTLCYTEMVAANALVHERIDSKKKAKGREGREGMGEAEEIQMDFYQKKNIHNSKLDVEGYGYDMTYIRRFLGQYNVDPSSSSSSSSSSSTTGSTNNQRHNPTVLQLGGSDPSMLEEATSIVNEVSSRGYCDYTAINLNCGCPSPKVAGKGNFGASLMNDPQLVRDIVRSMDVGMGGSTPITVKCRIGTDELLMNQNGGLPFNVQNYRAVDEDEEYAALCNFIETVASSGSVTDFQIHARIAVLHRNYSPTDNRKIPTLKYNYVRRLVEDFPELTFSLNGGIDSLEGVVNELESCEGLAGVMVGRAWAANPWSFAMADELLYKGSGSDGGGNGDGGEVFSSKPKNRLEVLQEFGKYADQEEEHWDPVKIRRFLIKAITPLFAGEPNGKRYRIALDEIAGLPKKLAQQRKSGKVNSSEKMMMDVPVSELIMNAALDNLSEDVLLRTPEESYERLLASSTRSNNDGQNQNLNRSQLIKDWQDERKEGDTQGLCNAT